MKLSELFCGLEITETNIGNFDVEVNKITDYSGEVRAASLFIALAGHRFNGHEYIGEALKRGAAVIVIDDSSYVGDFPYIRVPCARRAFSGLWNNFCGRPGEKLHLVAVTGTNGKSTVVSMIKQILEKSGRNAYSIGTLNSTLTTPDPQRLYPRLRELWEKGTRYVIMEASSHALALDKLSPLHFDIGVFTNLSRDHLDFHSDMDEYKRAKAKLFLLCDRAVYNYDDEYGEEITRCCREHRISYSLESDCADVTAKNLHLSLEGSRFELLSYSELFRIQIPIAGRYNASNALAAASVCRALGVSAEEIQNALKRLTTVSGRFEEVEKCSSEYRAIIDYAHTPDALKNILCSVRECMAPCQRLVCIFGCGGDRDRGKRSMMGAIAMKYADFSIITSDNPRSEDPYEIIRDIVKNIDNKSNYLIIENRQKAIEYAIHSAAKGDILLFCGKGHEDYEIGVSGKREFNEKKIIKDADKERIRIKGNEYNSCRQDENVSCGDSKDNRR